MDRRDTDFSTDEFVVRQDDPGASPSPKSSELFQQGAELYARGLFHEAVHVWTRILFLDRGNPDVRLRIDKAKAAIAERQRRLDAEVAEARGLFDSGRLEEAREGVRSVLAVDGRHPEAVALESEIVSLDRRTEPPREVPRAPTSPGQGAVAPAKGVVIRVPKGRKSSSGRSRRTSSSRFKMTAFLLVSLSLFAGSLVYLRENWETIVSDGAYGRSPGLSPLALPDRLAASVPDLSELRFYSGERLFGQGRYREALVELRLVDRDSSVGSEARSLILRIEDRLLRGSTEPEAGNEAVR